jgi:mannose-6-phosphate isomerase-like protein (cupin superfamily)
MPVTVVGKATNVVKTDSFAIDECAGNVATKDDRMSLARVWVSQPGQEPWLTLGYDEWIYCCSGRLVFGLPDGSTVELKAGETALVDKGTRFQPRFPEAGTSYIPVCIPAFRPDRCVREEASCCSGVAKRLAALHTKVEDAPEVLYHMVCFQCLCFAVDGVTPTPSVRRFASGSRRRRQSPRSASSPAGRPPSPVERPTSRPPSRRRASRTRRACLLDS